MASEKVLASKKEKVAKLAELIKNAKSGALVNYEGITVEEDTKLRKEMRENNINYFVEKNTMLRLAFKEAGIEGLDDVLHGTTAIAISSKTYTVNRTSGTISCRCNAIE
jgi:large subunit ribosomal protein L10